MAITDEQVKAALDAFYAMSKELLIDKNGFIRAATLQTRMRRALEAANAAAWRPIEEAPKDGTLIQVWRKNRNVVTAYWIKNQSCWKNPNIEIPALYDPTHWMPLPEPPR